MWPRSSKTLSISSQPSMQFNHLVVNHDVMGMMSQLYFWCKFIWDLPWLKCIVSVYMIKQIHTKVLWTFYPFLSVWNNYFATATTCPLIILCTCKWLAYVVSTFVLQIVIRLLLPILVHQVTSNVITFHLSWFDRIVVFVCLAAIVTMVI